MRFGRAAAGALGLGAVLALGACATSGAASKPALADTGVSAAAEATAPRDEAGKLVETKYDDRTDMLRAADMAAFVKAARAELVANPGRQPAIGIVVIGDDIAANRFDDAQILVGDHLDRTGGVGAVISALVATGQGDKERADIALKLAEGTAPQRLFEIAKSSIYEVRGDLKGAAQVLQESEKNYIFRQIRPGAPKDMEAFATALSTPDAVNFALRSAELQERLGDAVEAGRYYNLTLALSPDDMDARDGLARIAAGEKLDKNAFTIQKASARVYGALADDLAKREAVTSVLGAVLGGSAPDDSEFSPASSIFTQMALVLDPSDAKRQIGLASDMIRVGETDTALRVAQRVNGGRWQPIAQLVAAQAYLKESKDDRAVAEANAALKASPDDPVVLAQAGFVLGQAGQDAPAIAALSDAAEKSTAAETRIAVTLTRASVNFKFGRQSAAVADARRALAIAPDRPDVQAALATYLVEGQGAGYAEGLKILRQQLAESPDDAERMNAVGYSLLSQPATLDEGYRLLAKANAAAPFDWAIVDSIGWAHYLYGDFAVAQEYLEAAAKGFSSSPNPEVLDHLGDALWRQGKKDEAKAQWTKALAARPHKAMADKINLKLEKGLTTPAPKKRPRPKVDLTPPKPASAA